MNVNPKISAAAAAGAVTIVLVWAFGLLGIDVPTDVASAVTLIVAIAAGYVRSQGSWSSRV